MRRKRRRDLNPPPTQEEGLQAPIGVTSPDRTPSQIGTPMASPPAQPSGSPPRTRRRLRRFGETSTIGESSGQATAAAEAASGHPTIKTTLRFPSEEYLLSADRPSSPRWAEQIATSRRLAELEGLLEKLQVSEGSTAEREKRILEAEQKKAADLANEVARLEALVKKRDKEVKRAGSRKRQAIADLDKMKVEVRALGQQSKDLEAQLNAEQEARSAERTKAEANLKALQDSLTGSRAVLKKYKEEEPSRLAAARQEYLQSERGMHIPASDLTALLDDIPDAFFNFEDPE
ncbi:uncharacterized protein LOC122029085 [Zingiber officinale]|uniref:uncharacterized protein LOC122029085 n=1 Tax=Zingiber officinale TaxID=94328 RepID=UPI001C4DB30E|nr:uncharacterized protein LOC122029085 [Zingiber officinale]